MHSYMCQKTRLYVNKIVFEAHKEPILLFFFATFLTYISLSFGRRDSDKSQNVLDITFICSL